MWRARGYLTQTMNGQETSGYDKEVTWEQIWEAKPDMMNEIALAGGQHGRIVFKKPAN